VAITPAQTPVPAPQPRVANPSLVLIGLRGSGKSTIAALLARHLQTISIDLDDAVAAAHGVSSAADVINKHGLPAFRLAETTALRTALYATPRAGVIALGGGTPTAPGAAQLLAQQAQSRDIRIIYLRASPDCLKARLIAAPSALRPSLTGAGTLEEIETIYKQRDADYRALASEIIEVDRLTVEETVRLILARHPSPASLS